MSVSVSVSVSVCYVCVMCILEVGVDDLKPLDVKHLKAFRRKAVMPPEAGLKASQR